MFGLFLCISECADKADRRLDPFQFNYCIWNLNGFDSRQDIPKLESETKEIADVIYAHLSTCDVINLPGIYKQNTTDKINSQLKAKNIVGFELYKPNGTSSTTVISRLDVLDIKQFSNSVSYPIQGSKCNYTGPAGTHDFSGSFMGTVKFHDPVNDTKIMNVVFPHSETPELGCAIREALATEICSEINSSTAGQDIFVGGTFAASPSDPFSSILTQCGLKRGSKSEKKFATNNKNTITEDVYVFGGASKWLDVFLNVEQKAAIFSGQTPISYPVTLYVRQPLTARWKKFEIIYATCILIAASSFFTWLLIFSRVKTTDGYDKIPDGH